jgi:hypothetical protein
MHTRRQRLILDILTQCHTMLYHPSPANIAELLELQTGHRLGGRKTVTAEVVNLLIAGAIFRIERRKGATANRYSLRDCPCAYCKGTTP